MMVMVMVSAWCVQNFHVFVKVDPGDSVSRSVVCGKTPGVQWFKKNGTCRDLRDVRSLDKQKFL